MRYWKYFVLLAVLAMVPAFHAQAQVAIGVQIGPSYGYYHTPPPCPYGYYDYYPFDCAPYGYWEPQWFVEGVFVGAGPWYHYYYSHPVLYRRWYGPGYAYFPREHFHRWHGRRFDDDDDDDRWSHRHHDRGWHGHRHGHHDDDD